MPATIDADLRQRIVGLGLQGLRPRVIHEQIAGAVSIDCVYSVLRSARRQGARVPSHRPGPPATAGVTGAQVLVWIDEDHQLERLDQACRRRRMSRQLLLSSLVGAILDEPVLLDNLLDDLEDGDAT